MSDILEIAKALFEDAKNIELIEQNVACITLGSVASIAKYGDMWYMELKK